jgi:hypothetical protein
MLFRRKHKFMESLMNTSFLRLIVCFVYNCQVEGSDNDNYPLTRMVQRDIWLHQHPPNCKDPNVRFLVADWEMLAGFGIGAQLAGMTGLLAIAINEKRVLVTNYYNRADHPSCLGKTNKNKLGSSTSHVYQLG